MGNEIRFNKQGNCEQPSVFPERPRVNLNTLMERVKEEEKKNKRNNLVVSVVALSTAAVFGIILTL